MLRMAHFPWPHQSVVPDVGGASRLGGSTEVSECSFLSNIAYTRGPAVASVGTTEVSNSLFDANELSCAAGFYRHDFEEVTGRPVNNFKGSVATPSAGRRLVVLSRPHVVDSCVQQ